MSTKEMLHEEIETVSKRMKELEIGSPEYEASAKTWAMLMDRAIEIEKDESDRTLKKNQVEVEHNDRLVQHGISIGGIVLPLLVTIWGTLKSFKFEETGTVTTIMGRGFINKLLPRK